MREVIGAIGIKVLWAIMEDLSDQNRAEIRVLGLTPGVLASRLDTLGRIGHARYAVNDDGLPIAAMGVNKHPTDDFADTWFICTKAFFALGREGVRYSRARLKEFRQVYGLPLRSTSYSPLPETPRWFRALGFRQMPDRVDGSKVFVYC